jgi:hypothetical protein
LREAFTKNAGMEFVTAGLFFTLIGALSLGANLLAGQVVAPMDLLFRYAGWRETGASVGIHSVDRSDVVDSILPQWIFLRESIIKGHFPLWNPLTAGGVPGFMTVPQSTMSFGFLLFLLFGGGLGFTLGLWGRLVISSLGAHLLCRTKLSFLPSIFGGITYMLCGFNSSWLMVPAVETSMWVPWVLWAIIRVDEKPTAYRCAGLAAFVAAMIFAGFPAVAGYALYASALLALWLLARNMLKERDVFKTLRRVLWIPLGWLLGLGLTSVQVIPFIEYAQQFDLSWRSRVAHGLRPYLAALLVDPFLGGPPWVEYTGYVGILGICLAVVAVVYCLLRKRDYGPLSPKFWTVLAVLTLVMIYGTPAALANILYQLPVFNSSPSGRLLVLLGLEGAVLGALALEVFSVALNKMRSFRRLPHWRTVKVVLLLAIIAIQAGDLMRIGRAQNTIVPAQTFYPVTPAIQYVTRHLQPGQSVLETEGAFGVGGQLGAYGIPEWFAHEYHTPQETRMLSQLVSHPWVTPTAAGFEIGQIDLQSKLIDALAIRYIITTPDYEQSLNDLPAPILNNNSIGEEINFSSVNYIAGVELRMATYSRPTAGADVAVTMLDNNGQTVAESRVNGDNIKDNAWVQFMFNEPVQLYPRKYRFEAHLVGTPPGPVSVWSFYRRDNFAAGNMTVNGKQAHGDLTFVIIGVARTEADLQGWSLLMPGDAIIVLERQNTPPGAYLIPENMSDTPTWNGVTMLQYESDRVLLSVDTVQSGWLVRVARTWPGWVAYVNGALAQTESYLGVLPAVHVPAGSSRVEWRYEPLSLTVGAALSALTLAALSLLCMSYYRAQVSKKREVKRRTLDRNETEEEREQKNRRKMANSAPPRSGPSVT